MFRFINLSAIVATLVLTGSAWSANLVARYVLDGTADDSSGNAYHGVNTDATFVVDGTRGTVASFDGITGSIDLSASGLSLGDLPDGQFSTAFWILPTVNNGSNSNPDTLIVMGGNSPGKGVIEIVGDTSWGGMGGGSAQGGLGINSGGGGGKTGKVDTIDLYDGRWHHVVIQWAGDPSTDIEVWIDNTVGTTLGNGYNGSSTATTALRLGGPAVWSNGGSADKYYTGLLSDVRFFDGQLTASEVNALFTGGTVTPSGLVLEIDHNGITDQLTFTWNGEGGKTYNILGNADLSTAPSTWATVPTLGGVTSPQSISRSAATQYYVVEEAP